MGIKLLVPAIASILILGSVGMNQQSFAGVLEDCAFHIEFAGSPQLVEIFQEHADCPDGDFNTGFPIVVEYKPALTGVTSSVPQDQSVHLELPNFFDEFNTKSIRVEIVYDGNANVAPFVDNIKPANQDDDSCFPDSAISTIDPNNIVTLVEFWTCHPNPDNERVWIVIGEADVRSVNVWTVSFDRNAVGGDIIPLDTTMILVSGAQYTAAWMIPVIVSGIGFAIVIARKF